jgi:predicted lipoprotein with Yx(FWY)xxD motif
MSRRGIGPGGFMRFFNIRALAVVGVAAFSLAACGSSSKASSTPDTTTAATTATTAAPDTTAAPTTVTTAAPAATAAVTLASTKLGMVLVDAKGLTLYRFDNDTAAGKSTCAAGACASTWPAATVTGTPAAGTGVDTSKLTTFTRDDGKTQLQMDGHPLYTFAGDTKAGDTNGQGIGDKWYAVGADGDKVGDNS